MKIIYFIENGLMINKNIYGNNRTKRLICLIRCKNSQHICLIISKNLAEMLRYLCKVKITLPLYMVMFL
jgi:hypothetical protein